MNDGKCLIWGTPAEILKDESLQQTIYSDRAGGKYCFDQEAYARFQNSVAYQDDDYKTRLTTWLVDQRRLGIECPKISASQLKNVENRPRNSVQERASNFLRYLHSKSDFLGTVIIFKIQSLAFNNYNEKIQHELLA